MKVRLSFRTSQASCQETGQSCGVAAPKSKELIYDEAEKSDYRCRGRVRTEY